MMNRIQVITQKELVAPERLERSIVIVIDVFLATSSIIFLLDKGYGPIYSAENSNEAISYFKKLKQNALLLGEENGKRIEGFDYTDVTNLSHISVQKPVIICSTNGTRAIKLAKYANRLVLSSIINGPTVGGYLRNNMEDRSIVIICSGNAGHFSMEDMVGAGQLIDCLIKLNKYSLSDSSRVAHQLFLQSKEQQYQNLYESETAKLLIKMGYGEEIRYIINHIGKVNVVPMYKQGSIVSVKTEEAF
ncbi:2-phosphosulfolactate phosphatase [Oceanobacillus piezotolerans]|uniref:Probable 2-phosphosulfolactate phosphatase n=1 Tax=Oceanobacillus piezotolerans TaxID=2448030 RepID=A0A498D840_9BACI|nr:2-phosphosulfolactate phosphatase [Oceanobacillus piezotolerans]RLL46875.1 2-phosphosulfolactate phosphatase [Oceanobacillus piezotolerans]